MELRRSDPFPLLSDAGPDEEKRLSARIDDLLGFRIAEIETELSRFGSHEPAPRASGWKQELWLGLATQNLLTPYPELRRWVEHLSPRSGQTWVDLGCAYGRLGFLLSRLRPGVLFQGYEYVGERVREARRVAILNKLPSTIRFEHQDLCSQGFSLPEADVYLVYDFGSSVAIEKILGDLYQRSLRRSFYLIARGDRVRAAIERGHLWLRETPAPGVSRKAGLWISGCERG